jgi:hypothetical protein
VALGMAAVVPGVAAVAPGVIKDWWCRSLTQAMITARPDGNP